MIKPDTWPGNLILIGLFFLLFPLSLLSGTETEEPPVVREMYAIKTEDEIILDGKLDEEFWKRAPVTTGFIDQRSHQLAKSQTLVRIAYTRTHLYVAVECLEDEPDKIRATERREDRAFVSDDWIEVHFDPLHTRRNKYAFYVNPLGTKADGNEGPSGMFNYGWTTQWDAAASIGKDRWTVEMKIPLSAINFIRRNNQVWGVNFTRCQRHTDTISFWSFNPTDPYKPRNFGYLKGMDLADAKFDRNWETTPYVSSRIDFNGQTKSEFKAGLDTTFRLTPSIISSWTLYPDFGQVEADDDTIELRDTERFLPEKRLFFREGEELIRMPNRLYYSRRFTDIYAGGKVSGQWDGFSFTAMDIVGKVTHDGTSEGNSTVMRVIQNVREKDNIGYYVSDSELKDGHSRVVGIDGYFFVTDVWRYEFQLAGAIEERNWDTDLSDNKNAYLGSSRIIYSKYPFDVWLRMVAISPDFNPLLGYIPRRNIYGPNFYAAYHVDSEKARWKRIWMSYETQYFLDDSSDLSINDHRVFGNIVFQNDIGLSAMHSQDYHAPWHNNRTSMGISFFTSDFWKSISLTGAKGKFEEIKYTEIGLEKNFKPFERLPIRYEFNIRFEDKPDNQTDTPWLNRIVFDLYLAKDMWIKSSIQHRNDNVHNISIIYGWQFRKNTWWYLVFNSVRNPETYNSIFTKITYTF
jgi:hypothetical protein